MRNENTRNHWDNSSNIIIKYVDDSILLDHMGKSASRLGALGAFNSRFKERKITEKGEGGGGHFCLPVDPSEIYQSIFVKFLLCSHNSLFLFPHICLYFILAVVLVSSLRRNCYFHQYGLLTWNKYLVIIAVVVVGVWLWERSFL